jgi:hypothetical protein
MNAAPKNLAHKTLRRLSDLGAAGLLPGAPDAALEQVAARYAVAITPSWSRSLRKPPTRSATMPTARSQALCIAIPTACC